MTYIGKHFTNLEVDRSKVREIITSLITSGNINDTFTIPYQRSRLTKGQTAQLDCYIQKAPFRDRTFKLSGDMKWSSPQPYQFIEECKPELMDWWWNNEVKHIPNTKHINRKRNRTILVTTIAIEDWKEKIKELFQLEMFRDIVVLNGIKRKNGMLILPYHKNGGRIWTAFQGISRQGKKILLSGWNDYDINACAFVVMNHFCPMPAFQDIINNKIERRNQLSMELGIPIEKVKALITSTLFGVRTNISTTWWSNKPETKPALVELITERNISKIKQISWFMELVEQAQSARNQIVDNLYEQYYQKGGSGLYKIPHQVGQHLVLKTWNKNKIASFHYMCTELQMIQAIMELVGTDNVGYLHDGFVSLKYHQSEILVNKILDKVNINVSYKHENLDF